jgi:hypothetical protein
MFVHKTDPVLSRAALSMSYLEIYKDEVYGLLVNRTEVRLLYILSSSSFRRTFLPSFPLCFSAALSPVFVIMFLLYLTPYSSRRPDGY